MTTDKAMLTDPIPFSFKCDWYLCKESCPCFLRNLFVSYFWPSVQNLKKVDFFIFPQMLHNLLSFRFLGYISDFLYLQFLFIFFINSVVQVFSIILKIYATNPSTQNKFKNLKLFWNFRLLRLGNGGRGWVIIQIHLESFSLLQIEIDTR